MTGAIFSTLVVCVAFSAILVWAFKPSSKARWEERGRSIIDSNDESSRSVSDE